MRVLWKHIQNEMLLRAFSRFAEAHDIDTDFIEDEVDNFNEDKECNLHSVLQEHGAAMRALRSFVRHHRIMGKSFATGFPLFYWKWYRTATEQDIKGNVCLSSFMNLGGHSVAELSVYPHFDNLKEEAMATGLIGPQIFEKLVVQKAADHLKTAKCRKMKCKSLTNEGVFETSPRPS